MSTTLEGVEADLAEAQHALVQAQDALIAALERRVPAAEIALLETNIDLAARFRDDLQGTKEFIVEQERQRMVRDSKPMTAILYISKWADDFSPSDIPHLVFQSNAKNEVYGITGILYVLRRWFASYVEGDADAVDALIKRLQRDTRHTHFQVLQRRENLDPKQRKYPKSGLIVKHLDAAQDERQANPEATMLLHLTQHMALCDFVPTLGWEMRSINEQLDAVAGAGAAASQGVLATSGSGLMSAAKIRAQQEAELDALQARVSSANRFVLSVTSYGPLWDLPSLEQIELLERVHDIARAVIEAPSKFCRGTVTGAHNEALLCVLEGDAGECINRAVKLFDAIREDSALCFTYCPVVAIHYGKVDVVMNGVCGIVGPTLRYLRLLSTVAIQEGVPVIASHAAADEAQRQNVASLGFYMFDAIPDETFVPEVTAKLRWRGMLDDQRARQQHQIATHIEGPGPIDEVAVRRGVRPVRQPTSDDFVGKPVKGLITVEELREMFVALHPDAADDTIGVDAFNAMYYGQDSLGVDERVSEMADLLKRYACHGSGDADRVTFEQFCLIMYRRER